MSANVSVLEGFDLVGVTEKELGNSLLNRLHNTSRLRMALDEVSNEAPIHVFGSLDPLNVPLYFAAGAEVFDGLPLKVTVSHLNSFRTSFRKILELLRRYAIA